MYWCCDYNWEIIDNLSYRIWTSPIYRIWRFTWWEIFIFWENIWFYYRISDDNLFDTWFYWGISYQWSNHSMCDKCCIIVFTSIVFIIYDILMNRQALQQKLIIDTRRQFVRFISHEIRTPLNTIHLKNAISL